MASKSARKRRKRRPPPPQPAGAAQSTPEDEPPPVRTRAAARARRGDDEPPPAPWGSFPLVELAVLAGLIMIGLGFFAVEGDRGPILIAAGLALGSIGGLDLSIREHFAGYQSHTLLLAGVPALIVLAVLFYLGPDGLPPLARAGIAVAVFVAAAALLSRVFANRSGGLKYRFRPLRRR